MTPTAGPDAPSPEVNVLTVAQRPDACLVRLWLRDQGSPAYSEAEEWLVRALQATGWLPGAALDEVLAVLLPRWRGQQLNRFTRKYLWCVWRRLRSREFEDRARVQSLPVGRDTLQP